MLRSAVLLDRALELFDRAAPPRVAHAHCDIPCGIYDPHLMQIGALTVIRMNQLIAALEKDDQAARHSFARYTLVKEEHAELVKREVRVIFGDYFKPEHVEKFPELPQLTWDILKAGVSAAALGFPAIIRAQPKEVVILGLWDQTGAFADVGPLNDRGMRMALEERGMKVLGRPIKYVTRDGATQAGTSTRRAEEAIGRPIE